MLSFTYLRLFFSSEVFFFCKFFDQFFFWNSYYIDIKSLRSSIHVYFSLSYFPSLWLFAMLQENLIFFWFTDSSSCRAHCVIHSLYYIYFWILLFISIFQKPLTEHLPFARSHSSLLKEVKLCVCLRASQAQRMATIKPEGGNSPKGSRIARSPMWLEERRKWGQAMRPYEPHNWG